MHALSLTEWASRFTPAQRQGRRCSFARPSLESLEDRCALAGASVAAAVHTSNPAFQSSGSAALLALQNPFLVQPTATTSPTLGTTGSRYSLIQLPPTAAPASISLQGQGQNAIPSFASPTGFPGRLMLPNTGVTSRVPTGDGPMTASAGLFLPGGGDENAAPELPTPPRRIPTPIVPRPGQINIDLPAAGTDTDIIDNEDL